MGTLRGYWVGELSGTNSGGIALEIQHEGDRIYGKGKFFEPALGTYEYNIQGVITQDEKELSFLLTPHGPSHISLGIVEAKGSPISADEIQGRWKSNIGTEGTFTVRRQKQADREKQQPTQNSVFIVHGHDEATKEKVARFVEKVGLSVIILHEKINRGMTVIEKFEEYASQAGFAIALFTPDDIGYPLSAEDKKQPRARQNVVLELGYFVGHFGRKKVAVLYKGDVELPSDILGIVYTRIDDSDAWKLALAQELKGAGYTVDLNRILD
jgi:predicted nucleotide-binding protein